MAAINLVRVDDRLIHGQIMQVWSKGKGTNAIFVIDNETAADDFMKEIYESTQSTGSMKIKVFSASELIDEWNKNQFGDYKLILLFKKISEVKAVVEGGVPITELDMGNVSKKRGTTQVIPTVHLSENDWNDLKAISAAGVEVFFQNIPANQKVSMADATKIMG